MMPKRGPFEVSFMRLRPRNPLSIQNDDRFETTDILEREYSESEQPNVVQEDFMNDWERAN